MRDDPLASEALKSATPTYFLCFTPLSTHLPFACLLCEQVEIGIESSSHHYIVPNEQKTCEWQAWAGNRLFITHFLLIGYSLTHHVACEFQNIHVAASIYIQCAAKDAGYLRKRSLCWIDSPQSPPRRRTCLRKHIQTDPSK